jgi:hypothetical protein
MVLAQQFSVVAVMGPKQSGKTTLVKHSFPEHAYVSLEDLDTRSSAKNDPRFFFKTYENKKGLIIDEIQEVPELLSYMQGIVDQEYKPGFFIITGSQNFLMLEQVTQSLAGRVALLTLLPLTVSELEQAHRMPANLDELLIKGFYPRLYSQNISVETWISNYISTYVEKDIRQVLQIGDVLSFQKFLKLCASRVSNLINFAELARDCDISPHTAKAWLSVLETSYITKLLIPYHQNFNKRLIKSPKLYFYDTSLICFLLGIRTVDELRIHPMRGPIFESFVMSELFKYRFNQGKEPSLYFWRDVQGHEIDCIIEKVFGVTIPVEIKSGMTINESFFKELLDWKHISKQDNAPAYIIYGGDTVQEREHGTIIPWNQIKKVITDIYG